MTDHRGRAVGTAHCRAVLPTPGTAQARSARELVHCGLVCLDLPVAFKVISVPSNQAAETKVHVRRDYKWLQELVCNFRLRDLERCRAMGLLIVVC